LEQPEEADRPTAAETDGEHEYAAVFENVSFSYAPGHPILRGLDLKIRRGQTTAIVGPSGCGKSTVIRLLARLYAPDSGEIRLFGAPQSGLSNQAIRRCLALIPQEAGLFDGTVAENLRLGNANATPAQINAALDAASLNDLPEGGDTLVGENGTKLSGGQRQRAAIARALLRDAPICLLDEATSALDVNTEEAVQAALRNVNRGRTVVCVAHRLSTIVDADEIVYMEGGQVKERGTHPELVALRGGYWRLVQAGQQ
ncbi:MAG TPA: ATP-binding cassette domain-containing protein, partial [Clostridia bacterium]|nr:ATP-binding cassette domain-containing protein [Clostridia bacterium]